MIKKIIVCMSLSVSLTSYSAETLIEEVQVGTPITAARINQMINFVNIIKGSGRYIVKKSQSSNSWYEIYNDGWVVQGGVTSSTGTNSWKTQTIPVRMRDNFYRNTLQLTKTSSSSVNNENGLNFEYVSTNSFSYQARSYNNGSVGVALNYQLFGYGDAGTLSSLLGYTFVYE